VPNFKNYMSLAYASRDVSAGSPLYVSHGAIFDTQWMPKTIAWDTEYSDPENQHGSWTILTGPAWYQVTAFARLMQMEQDCSVHIFAYHATAPTVGQVDGVDNITSFREFTEWFVGHNETHIAADGTVTYSNTHVFGTWPGYLPIGEKLRIALDYWNAGGPGKLVGGSVYGYWGRPADEIVIPVVP
jgi:hypothetical protein